MTPFEGIRARTRDECMHAWMDGWMTRGLASRERASRAVDRGANERTTVERSLDLDVRPRDLDRRVRSRRRRGYTMASVAHRLSASAAVVSSSRANGARGGTTRGVKGTRAKGARGTAGMTRAMAREGSARATRFSTRSRSAEASASPRVRSRPSTSWRPRCGRPRTSPSCSRSERTATRTTRCTSSSTVDTRTRCGEGPCRAAPRQLRARRGLARAACPRPTLLRSSSSGGLNIENFELRSKSPRRRRELEGVWGRAGQRLPHETATATAHGFRLPFCPPRGSPPSEAKATRAV